MLLLATILALFAPLQSAPRPAQIILIRHAEKPADEDNPHLSAKGVQRAKQLVAFLTTYPAMTKFGPPVAIYATETTKHDDGVRTQETMAPLAKALRLPVQTPYLSKNYASLAEAILANGAYAGKTIVICWNHQVIPELVAALGVMPRPPKWKGGVFDRVYLITYPGGKATLMETSEQLGAAK